MSLGRETLTLGREPAVLEKAIQAVAERARDAYRLVEEASDVGLGDEAGLMIAAKSLRAELLRTKGELERAISRWILECERCNRRVYWVIGVGPEPGHWAHTGCPRSRARPRLNPPLARPSCTHPSRAADYETAEEQAGYLRKFMNILVRAFTWLL